MFLVGRLYICLRRCRSPESLLPRPKLAVSDHFLIISFVLILSQTIIITLSCIDEIRLNIHSLWPSATRFVSTGGFCTPKMQAPYNIAQFFGHVLSTITVTVLPMLVLTALRWWTKPGGDAARCGAGRARVRVVDAGVWRIGSVGAFVTFWKMGGVENAINPASRYVGIRTSVADQKAIFLGGRIRGRGGRETMVLQDRNRSGDPIVG